MDLARWLHRVTGERGIVLAGGVALNCVANARLAREGPFERAWVQPAAGDAGTALGGALWCAHGLGDDVGSFSTAALGRGWSDDEIEVVLHAAAVGYHRPDDLAATVAGALAAGAVVGWFQGRSEYGPRALGHRSLLVQARVIVPRSDRPMDWERSTAALESATWITADMAVRRDVLTAVGGFDERLEVAQPPDQARDVLPPQLGRLRLDPRTVVTDHARDARQQSGCRRALGAGQEHDVGRAGDRSHRRPGEHHIAHVVESADDDPWSPRHAAPPMTSATALAKLSATTIPLGTDPVAGLGTKMAAAPAAVAAATSAARSPRSSRR